MATRPDEINSSKGKQRPARLIELEADLDLYIAEQTVTQFVVDFSGEPDFRKVAGPKLTKVEWEAIKPRYLAVGWVFDMTTHIRSWPKVEFMTPDDVHNN